MLKKRLIKFIYYIISSIIFIAAFREPIETVFIELVKKTFTEIDKTDGIIDLQLYKIYPTHKGESEQIFSLYKGQTSEMVEIKKVFTVGDKWSSNDAKMQLFIDSTKNNLVAVSSLDNNHLLGMLSNSSSLISINGIKHREANPLMLFTQHEYYFQNLKNVAGVSLVIGAGIFILITGYYNNKKIQSNDDDKKKNIIIIKS